MDSDAATAQRVSNLLADKQSTTWNVSERRLI